MARAQPLSRSSKATASALKRYQAARAAASEAFLEHSRIHPLWKNLSAATDALLIATAKQTRATLIAVGGYGRREMFPYSDVDVLVLLEDASDRTQENAIIHLLQQLWDLGVPVSHATRTREETVTAARADASVCAGLMDARFLCGSRHAFRALHAQLHREVFGSQPHAFVTAKLHERDVRHARFGDSRFVLEPNIKEGKGGLRDLQTLTWLARYCYRLRHTRDLVREDLLTREEWRQFREAYQFFSVARAHMHSARGRADERLTFDLQTHIARALRFPGKNAQQKAEKFMRRYFEYTREVGVLTRHICAILEEENIRDPLLFPSVPSEQALPASLVVKNGRLHVAAPEHLSKQSILMVALFYHAQQRGMDIHPRAYLAIRRALPKVGPMLACEREAQRLLLAMLLSPAAPEITLRRLSESGVLAALIPEFGRITGMMQYDGYHTYTVDEHTLVAIGNLAMIERGAWEKDMPLATELAQELSARAPLYLALLCHDLAKGKGGKHHEQGESLARHIATRLGLDAANAELTGWLVRHHLLVSETAIKRDLEDDKTIRKFVEVVQSPERLRLLLLLTAADMKAVGPGIWNPWKGGLMRDLYHRALLRMEEGGTLPDRGAGTDNTANTLYRTWQQAPLKPALTIHHDPHRAVSEVMCCMGYSRELLQTLAGVMAWIGASIVSARSHLTEHGAMIAHFGIQDAQGKNFANDPKRLAPLAALIEKGLRGELDFATELAKRRTVAKGREVSIAPNVTIDNQISAEASVIEIQARDRIGLLYDILGALEACQVHVVTAHIATYGKKAEDVFYVKDVYGNRVTHRGRIAAMKRHVLAAIHEGDTV